MRLIQNAYKASLSYDETNTIDYIFYNNKWMNDVIIHSDSDGSFIEIKEINYPNSDKYTQIIEPWNQNQSNLYDFLIKFLEECFYDFHE